MHIRFTLFALTPFAIACADPPASPCGSNDEPARSTCPTDSGTGCAPNSTRVDRYTPTFSNPTEVTNPLFPIARLASVVFHGVANHEPFRSETTLLPETRFVSTPVGQVEALQSQYMAFSDGRIEEIATDLYAQDDRGAVWYLGEEVADFNDDGAIYTHEGTWQVNVDGAPLTMIMPRDPQVGDAFLTENVPPIAWEQVVVSRVNVTVPGPSGPVEGAIVGTELHSDDTTEEKIFAPGYGEFSTGTLADDNLEALAVAIPTDSLAGPAPEEIRLLAVRSADLFDGALLGDWASVTHALSDVKGARARIGRGVIPPLIADVMEESIDALARAAEAHDALATRHHAIAVARSTYDVLLRYTQPDEVDRARFDLWLAQAQVDLEVGDVGAVRGDAATAGLLWRRFAHTFDRAAADRVSGALDAWSRAAAREDAAETRSTVKQLRAIMEGRGWRGDFAKAR